MIAEDSRSHRPFAHTDSPPPLLLSCHTHAVGMTADIGVPRSHAKGEGRMKAWLAAFPVTIAKKNKTVHFGSDFT